jgi:hypothetical protein
VAWGLGWGLEPAAGTFFHWGDNGPYTAFVIGSVAKREALVVFTNGASGLAIVPDIVADLMPGERPSLAWLDYTRHDAPVRRLLRTALDKGAAEAWPEIQRATLGKTDMRWIAQGLEANGRMADGRWLRRQAS